MEVYDIQSKVILENCIVRNGEHIVVPIHLNATKDMETLAMKAM